MLIQRHSAYRSEFLFSDLDIVVNNMNAEAHVYRNNADKLPLRNYLRIKFDGRKPNRDGTGAKLTVYHNSKRQFFEHFASRGFESTVDGILHVGLDSTNAVDSLEVIWPDGSCEKMKNITGVGFSWRDR